MVTYQLQVKHKMGKVRPPETKFLPLFYTTNLNQLTQTASYKLLLNRYTHL